MVAWYWLPISFLVGGWAISRLTAIALYHLLKKAPTMDNAFQKMRYDSLVKIESQLREEITRRETAHGTN